VFPLIVALLNEKSLFDTVSSEGTKKQLPSTSATSKKETSSGSSSRHHLILNLVLNVLNTLCMKMKSFSSSSLSEEEDSPYLATKPVILLEPSFSWICMANTILNDRKQSTEQLVTQFSSTLQQRVVDLLSSLNEKGSASKEQEKMVSKSLATLLTKMITILLDLRFSFPFIDEGFFIFDSLLSYFPLSLKEEEEQVSQKHSSFQQIETLNLSICQIVGIKRKNEPVTVKYIQDCLRKISLEEKKGGLGDEFDGVSAFSFSGKFYSSLFQNLSSSVDSIDDVMELVNYLSPTLMRLKQSNTDSVSGNNRPLATSLSDCFYSVLLFSVSHLSSSLDITFLSSQIQLTMSLLVLSLKIGQNDRNLLRWTSLLKQLLVLLSYKENESVSEGNSETNELRTIHSSESSVHSIMNDIELILFENGSFSTFSREFQECFINDVMYFQDSLFGSFITLLATKSLKQYFSNRIIDILAFIIHRRFLTVSALFRVFTLLFRFCLGFLERRTSTTGIPR
jgi:hypothetical protein